MTASHSPVPPAPPPNAGYGAYVLVDRIAVGGMAEVFRGLEPRPVGEPRTVVIKRMLPAIATERGAQRMFEEEARLGKLIVHQNVVQVLDAGEVDGKPYLALEYVRGLDLWRLTRWLTREGRTLDRDLALHIVRAMLAGLHAVHEARDAEGRPLDIVHRDVSPSNLLLSIHGDIKLGDFGIARAKLRERYPQATLGDRAKGKLGYLAPEQVRGDEADRRADVFAAGVIMAELLMGRPLFSGGSELAVLLAIRDAKVHPFTTFAPELPVGLGGVVLRALAREPKDRLGSAAEFAEQLATFQEREEEGLSKELGDLVTRASGAQGLLSHDVVDAVTPVRESMWETKEEDTHGQGLLGEVTTGELPTLQYRVRTVEGESLGPWPYAKVIEAVATGRLRGEDNIADRSGDYREIREVQELARHIPPLMLTPTAESPATPAPPLEQMSLHRGGIVGVLAGAALRKDTGLWLCEVGEIRKEVYLSQGAPQFVTSNLAGELLGEHLVSRGVITRSELDMALAVMPRFEGRLGNTLTALGLVEPVSLFQHIADQVRDKLLDLFVWGSGTAEFYGGVAPPPSGFPLDLDPWQILDEGLRNRATAGMDQDFLDRHLNRRAERSATWSKGRLEPRLPVVAQQALECLDGGATLERWLAALADLGVEDAQAKRTVLLLHHLDAAIWTD